MDERRAAVTRLQALLPLATGRPSPTLWAVAPSDKAGAARRILIGQSAADTARGTCRGAARTPRASPGARPGAVGRRLAPTGYGSNGPYPHLARQRAVCQPGRLPTPFRVVRGRSAASGVKRL